MKKRWLNSGTAGYVALIAACLAVAMVAGWNRLASEVDVDVYDWMFRRNPPPPKLQRARGS